MIALLYFLFFIVYLVVSLWVIRTAYRFTKHRYQRGWAGGLLAVLVMYNLVFWDLIPVFLKHKYYCETDAGFWVYKTPEQWIKEYPELIGQDWNNQTNRKREKLISGYWHYATRIWLSENIYQETEHHRVFVHAIARDEKKLIDANTGQILSKSIEYKRGGESSFAGGGTLTDLKPWLAVGKRYCGTDQHHTYNHDFRKYLKQLIQATKISGEKK